MKYVIAPDSFKESLTASQVAQTISDAIRSVNPDASIVRVPMADGGEGTVEALIEAAQGTLHAADVTGPSGERCSAGYGKIKYAINGGAERGTAVLEAATLFGLSMIANDKRDPYLTTTRGMGELIVQLLDQGIRSFIIGLGGSGTNDGGMGLLAALGVRFLDEKGNLLAGYGRDLAPLHSVDMERLDARLSECEILVASDVQNPLCGKEGASAVYGPQKGATPDQVEALDRALNRYAGMLEESTGSSFRDRPGAGAAGGAGFALLMIGAKIMPGAELIGSAANLRSKMNGADWVITGEGKSDNQTLFGKLPMYVARLAKESGIRTLLISGSLGSQSEQLGKEFAACFACVPRPMPLSECLEQAESNLYQTAINVIRLVDGNGHGQSSPNALRGKG
ncbi:glycerate kinase family protein [Cohnella herbarum]|uniref:Glycerate kinase n=1 Tax=Cohnella herbarum TaxID=2728023 RepID=A0A7Z2VP24_9BACL|nr:glycerate kinase [Cohnella herbarum]QJD86370.1 glycerate kinase [Cohnella herbarum]